MTLYAQRVTKELVVEQGWKPGTTLENWVAFRLAKWKLGPDLTTQQHRVDKYRIDFAWPKVQIGLEADGWHHQSPDGAVRDARRDSYLRSQGWLILRVDDLNGEESLLSQLCWVVRVVRKELEDSGICAPNISERERVRVMTLAAANRDRYPRHSLIDRL